MSLQTVSKAVFYARRHFCLTRKLLLKAPALWNHAYLLPFISHLIKEELWDALGFVLAFYGERISRVEFEKFAEVLLGTKRKSLLREVVVRQNVQQFSGIFVGKLLVFFCKHFDRKAFNILFQEIGRVAPDYLYEILHSIDGSSLCKKEVDEIKFFIRKELLPRCYPTIAWLFC